MTNEEKAQEILKCGKCGFRNKTECNECFDKKAVLEMAEWKDAQFEKVTQMLRLQLYAYSKEISSKTVMTIIQQAEELYKN